MIIPRLAVRNMLGAGTKTWLNAIVLSFSFVAILWGQSLFKGFGEETARTMSDAEFGGGQYWVQGYDPLDPFSIQDAHASIEGPVQTLVLSGRATPILVVQGTIYPAGRILPVLLKGIDPDQKILTLPSGVLRAQDSEIPALIGARMARSAGLEKGDTVTARWRDSKGTFDARELVIADIFQTTAQSVDAGQIWIRLDDLRRMAAMPGEATIVVTEKGFGPPESVPGWTFKDLSFLNRDTRELIRMKSFGVSIFYMLLFFLAMLAIFNTQVLSVFRRRKEIGTMMALGLTRGRVIWLFTLEGAMQSVLALLVGAIYGIPFLVWFGKEGWKLPSGQADSFGLSIGNTLYPAYSMGLVVGTAALVFIATTIISFLPTRRIVKLKPTEALRGRTK
jgi:putative ABC transport system permease protein